MAPRFTTSLPPDDRAIAEAVLDSMALGETSMSSPDYLAFLESHKILLPGVTPDSVRSQKYRLRKKYKERESAPLPLECYSEETQCAVWDAINLWPPASPPMPRFKGGVRTKRDIPKGPQGAPAETKPGEAQITAEGKNGGDTLVVTAKSTTIRTLEDAIEAARVDTERWEVDRYVVNKWDNAAKVNGETGDQIVATELWQVKVWLKRRVPVRAEMVLDGFAEKLKVGRPPQSDLTPGPAGGRLLEISLCDTHFGKLAWAPETGNNYDLEIAQDVFRKAVEELVDLAGEYSIERFLLPIGNDFLHIDNPFSTTTAGTRQDTDGRFAKILETGWLSATWAVDYLAEIAPVHVLTVTGNHDEHTMISLGTMLRIRYEGCEAVTLDCTPKARKYYRYGCTLLGFTHGNQEKHSSLPNIMATEEPEQWAKASHREWHLGHLHQRRKTDALSVDSHEGTVVRVLPSIAGTDAWHYRKGYIGPRAAEAYLWDRQKGYVGHFSTNVTNS